MCVFVVSPFLLCSARRRSGEGGKRRRSGEHVRTWGQNLTHTAGGGVGPGAFLWWGRDGSGRVMVRRGAAPVWCGGPRRAQAKWCGGGSKRAPSRTVRLPRRLSLACSRARRVAASQADGWRAGRLGGLVGTARQPSQPDTRCPSRDRWRGTRLGGGGSGAPRGGGPRGGRAGRRGAVGVPAVPPARRTWGAARLVGHRGGPRTRVVGLVVGSVGPAKRAVPCPASPLSPRGGDRVSGGAVDAPRVPRISARRIPNQSKSSSSTRYGAARARSSVLRTVGYLQMRR